MNDAVKRSEGTGRHCGCGSRDGSGGCNCGAQLEENAQAYWAVSDATNTQEDHHAKAISSWIPIIFLECSLAYGYLTLHLVTYIRFNQAWTCGILDLLLFQIYILVSS